MTEAASRDEMVRAAARGEHWALEQLFTSSWPVLLDYYRALGWSDMAEELAMNVWAGLLDGGLRRARSESEQEFRQLLFTIARRRLVDHQRRGLRSRAVCTPAGLVREPVAVGTSDDPAEVVGGQLQARDAVRFLRDVLPAAQAEVVMLRVRGFKVEEVATTVGRSPKAVSMLYRRALRRLGAVLSSREAGGE